MTRTLVLAVALLLALAIPAQATTITGSRYSYPFGWNYSYDISYTDHALLIDIDIRLTGASVTDTLLNRWESGIESLWSTNRFDVPILFNVDWVTEGWDYSVNVTDAPGRWTMRSWYTIGAAWWGDSYQEEVAAHEYGHMLSLWDEYSGGAVDPVTRLVNTGGLMATLSGPTLDWYYDPFLDWYHAEYDEPVPTPEPGTLVLLLTSIPVFLAMSRLRRKPGYFSENP